MSRRAEYRSGAFAAGGDPGDSGAAVNCVIDWDRQHCAWVARGTPHEGAVAFEARSDSSPASALLVFAQWLGCVADQRARRPRRRSLGSPPSRAPAAAGRSCQRP